MVPTFRHVEEKTWIRIYDPNGKQIAYTNNELDFANFRYQIVVCKISGYYYIIDGDNEKIEILTNGKVSNPKKFPFSMHVNLLAKIIKEGSQNELQS